MKKNNCARDGNILKNLFNGLLVVLLLIAIFFLPSVYADNFGFANRWYHVEVIIFSQLTPQTINSQSWQQTLPENFLQTNIIQLNQVENSNYQLLSTKDYLLNNEARKLQRQGRYQIILHLAWKQKISSPEKTVPIHIFGGAVYNSAKITNNNNFSHLNYSAGMPWRIDGTVKISVLRYFNVQCNLYFAATTTQLNEISGSRLRAANNIVYAHLLQNQRMRSNELNYIGNPLYGVLIKIVRD